MKHLFTLALLLALGLCIAPSFADEKKDTKPADNEASLDDLLKLPGSGDAKKPDDKGKPLPPATDVPRTGDESVDAILKAIAEMEQAGQRLKVRQDAGIDTQRIQESVLKRLDQAIAIAQKQKQEQQQQQKQQGKGQEKQENGSQENQQQKKPGEQGNKPGEKQPNSDGNKSEQVSPEKVEATAGGPIEESRIEWGRLPARVRGELDQGLAEKFSPLYKKLTEAYYRRLAEEGKD